MESKSAQLKSVKKESRFKTWLTNLFCMREERIPPAELGKRSERMSKTKQKLTIQMSLLGSYKASTLCKISRKNFIVNSHQLDNGRLPAVCSKHLGERVNSPTAVVVGEVSAKVVKGIPWVFRLINQEDKVIGESIQSDVLDFRTKIDDLCIYRPKFQFSKIPSLLNSDNGISKRILHIIKSYKDSVIIFPKDTILDEIGVLLSEVQKFVEIQTIVANATTLCIVAYVGSKEFVGISENQHLEFVVKELNKDLTTADPNISIFARKICVSSSVFELLNLLRKSIQDAFIDTIFECFLRNAIFRQIITPEQVTQLFPSRYSQNQFPHTPSLRMTARFNNISSGNFKSSCSDDFLNGENGELLFENEVETFAETEITMVGMEILNQYNPY